MKSLHKVAIGVALVAGMGGLIYAGPGDVDDTDSSSTVTTTGNKSAQLSPGEMIASADQLMGQMHSSLRHVTQLHQKAAKDKDIIKLNCINDKLMPMKGEVNLADANRHALDQAINAGDDSARYASYSDLTISGDKVKDLRDAADACVGDALTYVGSTDVQVTGPANPLLPGDDNWGGSGIEPPGYRTPFD
jgi:hypothetical protein